MSKLKENIAKNIKEASYNNVTNFPLIVTYTATGHAYKIEADGTVSKNIGLSLDKEQITFKVVNGTVQSPTTEKITATLQGITGTVNWTSDDENEEVISLDINENEVTITANGIGVAKVTASLAGEEPVTCNIIVKELQTAIINTNVLPANKGTVTIDGEEPYIVGSTLTITAIPIEGYKFKQWSDGSKDNPLTYNVLETEATLTATFEEKIAFREYKTALNSETYGNIYRLNNGNRITISNKNTEDTSDDITIEDNWKIFYEDEDFKYLIYGNYYPTDAQRGYYNVGVNIGSTDSNYPFEIYGNEGNSNQNFLKYLRNYSGYVWSTDGKDGFISGGNTWAAWNALKNALSQLSILSGKSISIQASPDIDLWIKSWNAKGYISLKTEKNSYGHNIMLDNSEATNSDYYINVNTDNNYNKTNDESNHKGYYDELYFPYREYIKGNGTSGNARGYWIASPSAKNTSCVGWIKYDGDVCFAWGHTNKGYCARPVLAISK